MIRRAADRKRSVRREFFDFDGELGLPKVVEIEPTEACNLKCRMCHVSFMPQGPRAHIGLEPLRKLRVLKDALIVLGSNFEPTMHPEFPQMLSMFNEFGFRLDIVTNGTLLNDRIIDTMTEGNFGRIAFSFDGIRKETYEYIRRNANYERTVENILKTRKAFVGRDTFFCINNVIMRCNIDELIEAVDFWDANNFDRMNLVFMVLRENNEWLSQQNLHPIRDYAYDKLDEAAEHVIEKNKRLMVGCAYYSRSTLKRVYPNNFEDSLVFADRSSYERFPRIEKTALQRGTFAGMKFKECRSAFVFARILPNGDVQLCYKEIVGNINAASFEEIWFGEKAGDFRKKLMATTDLCKSCTYWLFCLNQHNLDTDDGCSYLGGTFRHPSLAEENYKGYNIISFRGRFYGLAQGEGRLDLNRVGAEGYRCVVGESPQEVKELVERLAPKVEKRRLIEEGYKGFNIISAADKFYGLAQSEGRLDVNKVGTEGYRCVTGDSPDEVKSLVSRLIAREET
jgi:radical SAM protein with 4Fe4S-binding SPASM domain